MGEQDPPSTHSGADAEGLGGGRVSLGDGVAVEFVFEGGLVQEDGGGVADFGEGARRPAVAGVGELEAVGEGQRDGFGAVAVVDVDGLQVGEAGGGGEGFFAGGRGWLVGDG